MSGAYAAYSLEQLVRACAESGTADVWNEFVTRTHGLVTGTVVVTIRRWKVCQMVSADDVIQEVYLKISANRAAVLRNFEARHPNAVLGYLRAVASSVAQDYCKKLSAAKRGAGKEEPFGDVEPVAAERAGTLPDVERDILIGEIEQILEAATEGANASRDRNIFWLYYRQGFTAGAIAAIPQIGLTVKGVESTIQRLTRIVREQLGSAREMAGGIAKGMRARSSF